MDSIYFDDPLGLTIELAAYRFEPPAGFTHAEVLLEAHKLRFARGDHHISQVHLADAIEDLVAPFAGIAFGRPVGQEPVLTPRASAGRDAGPRQDMAETASCAGRGAGLASSACPPPRSSAPRQPASRPATSSRRGSGSLRPVEPPCGQEPFDDLAAVFPSRRLGCSASTTLGTAPRARLRCARIGDRLADRRGARGARRRSAANVIEGWNAYRDHGPRLVGDGGCDVRLGRGGVGTQGTGGAARVAAAHGPRAGGLRGRAVRGRAGPCDRAARPSADDLGLSPRRSPRSSSSRADRRFAPERFAAIERHAYGRIHVRAPRPAPAGRGPDRGSVAGGRAPGRERDRRRGLRRSSRTTTSRARAVVARQLARYASSALVGACTREPGR